MRSAALFAIELYQRYLSPHKGYCCAYRIYTGSASCSVLGYRAIRRFGLWDGLALLRERLALCGVAYRRWRARIRAPRERARLVAPRERGFVDGLCDVTMCIPDPGDLANAACDMSSSCGGSPCDVLDCSNGRGKKNPGRDQAHLPRFAEARRAV